jgi:hypothetical protein
MQKAGRCRALKGNFGLIQFLLLNRRSFRQGNDALVKRPFPLALEGAYLLLSLNFVEVFPLSTLKDCRRGLITLLLCFFPLSVDTVFEKFISL